MFKYLQENLSKHLFIYLKKELKNVELHLIRFTAS